MPSHSSGSFILLEHFIWLRRLSFEKNGTRAFPYGFVRCKILIWYLLKRVKLTCWGKAHCQFRYRENFVQKHLPFIYKRIQPMDLSPNCEKAEGQCWFRVGCCFLRHDTRIRLAHNRHSCLLKLISVATWKFDCRTTMESRDNHVSGGPWGRCSFCRSSLRTHEDDVDLVCLDESGFGYIVSICR